MNDLQSNVLILFLDYVKQLMDELMKSRNEHPTVTIAKSHYIQENVPKPLKYSIENKISKTTMVLRAMFLALIVGEMI